MQGRLVKWANEQYAQGKRSPYTHKKTLNWITRFTTYMEKHHNVTTIQGLTKKVVREYYTNNFKNKANQTQIIAYFNMKSFFNWCIDNKLLLQSPL